MGGGSLANEDAPPHPVKTYLHGKRLNQEPQNIQQWQEAKPRTSIFDDTTLVYHVAPMIAFNRTTLNFVLIEANEIYFTYFELHQTTM